MLKEGDTLMLEDGYELDDKRKRVRIKKYKVIQILKYTVLMEDEFGFKRCAPKGDFIRLGYLQQEPKYEALRAERNG